MKLRTLLCSLALLLMPALAPAQTGQAQTGQEQTGQAQTGQDPLRPVVTVNGVGITAFELDQRARLLAALGDRGDVAKAALDALIDDSLREFAARQMGITVSQDELDKGLAEFTARANLTPQQFMDELARQGVYPETFRQFVRTGLAWRKLVVTKFRARAFVSDAELDTAIELGTTSVGASVLISELILPFQPGTEGQALELLNRLRGTIRNAEDFANAALTYSSAASRANGGRLDWMPIGNLPPEVGKMVLTMRIGQISTPVRLGNNAYAIFMLRGLRDNREVAAKTIAYDYATLLLPGGRSPATQKIAAAIEGRVDSCNDLLAEAGAYPPEAWKRQVVPVGKVPRDIATELSHLDRNEVSTRLTRRDKSGEKLVFLMLCGRTNQISEGNREQVRQTLLAQRLEAFGNGYLQELRADAIITRK